MNPKNVLVGKEWVREALLYEPSSGGRVRCRVCERRCTMHEGKTGFCKTKMNIGGRLYALTYGDISAISENPIEKKPLFHFFRVASR